jgi:hypothetical protein
VVGQRVRGKAKGCVPMPMHGAVTGISVFALLVQVLYIVSRSRRRRNPGTKLKRKEMLRLKPNKLSRRRINILIMYWPN